MVYEEMTYERIMSRCLARVPATVDKREGSIIYDAIAPAAAELAILYSTLSTEMDRAFPDTAADVDLTNKAKERGVFRLPSSAAVRKGVFKGAAGYMDIPIGARFSGGTVNYRATRKESLGIYEMTCEESGEVGNAYFGNLIPIDYIAGLTSAELQDILIPGEDEESDDELRARYMQSLSSTAFGGNVAQYKQQLEQLEGVGAAKIFPVWAGGGTVKAVLVDSSGGVPSSQLIEKVQTAIDPEVNGGEGLGLAPIGHRVTIEEATGTTVNVAFTLTLESSTGWETVKTAVEAAIQRYFDNLIAAWADSDHLTVRISQLESRVLDVPGVLDISGTTLNGAASNLELSGIAIPVLGEVENHAA